MALPPETRTLTTDNPNVTIDRAGTVTIRQPDTFIDALTAARVSRKALREPTQAALDAFRHAELAKAEKLPIEELDGMPASAKGYRRMRHRIAEARGRIGSRKVIAQRRKEARAWKRRPGRLAASYEAYLGWCQSPLTTEQQQAREEQRAKK